MDDVKKLLKSKKTLVIFIAIVVILAAGNWLGL